MISFFSKHKKPIFVITTVIFLAGIFVGLGGYFFSSSSLGAVALIGSKKVSYKYFLKRVNMILDRISESGTEINEGLREEVKREVFRNMIIEEMLSQEAKRYGILVSDFEVSAEVQNTPQFRDEKGFNPRVYYYTIMKEMGMTPSEYEQWRRKVRLASNFREFIYTTIKVTPAELASYYLSKGGNIRDFKKEKDKYLKEITEQKFLEIMNYYLQMLTTKIEVRSYLKEREEGR